MGNKMRLAPGIQAAHWLTCVRVIGINSAIADLALLYRAMVERFSLVESALILGGDKKEQGYRLFLTRGGKRMSCVERLKGGGTNCGRVRVLVVASNPLKVGLRASYARVLIWRW